MLNMSYFMLCGLARTEWHAGDLGRIDIVVMSK